MEVVDSCCLGDNTLPPLERPKAFRFGPSLSILHPCLLRKVHAPRAAAVISVVLSTNPCASAAMASLVALLAADACDVAAVVAVVEGSSGAPFEAALCRGCCCCPAEVPVVPAAGLH